MLLRVLVFSNSRYTSCASVYCANHRHILLNEGAFCDEAQNARMHTVGTPIRGISLMVEHQFSKLRAGVRFSYSAHELSAPFRCARGGAPDHMLGNHFRHTSTHPHRPNSTDCHIPLTINRARYDSIVNTTRCHEYTAGNNIHSNDPYEFHYKEGSNVDYSNGEKDKYSSHKIDFID